MIPLHKLALQFGILHGHQYTIHRKEQINAMKITLGIHFIVTSLCDPFLSSSPNENLQTI